MKFGILLLVQARSFFVFPNNLSLRTCCHDNNCSSKLRFFRLYNGSEDESGDSSFDVESARRQLQSIFSAIDGDETEVSQDNCTIFDLDKFLVEASKDSKASFPTSGVPLPIDDSLIPAPPPLSTIERDRREAEIQLLKQLERSDEATQELWNLWYSERGSNALARLQQTDQLLDDPTSWQDCETSLRQLVDEFSIYFVEPVNRLATLYSLQGKLEESYHLCRLILLQLKPWHLGALSGMVQVCLQRGDRDEARYWASKRLPSLVAGNTFPGNAGTSEPSNPRRVKWVEEMTQMAKKRMAEAEKSTQAQFGKPEEYYSNRLDEFDNKDVGDCEDDNDVWQ